MFFCKHKLHFLLCVDIIPLGFVDRCRCYRISAAQSTNSGRDGHLHDGILFVFRFSHRSLALYYGTYGRPIVFGIFTALVGSALANTACVWWNLASFDPKAPRRPRRRWRRMGQRWQQVLDQVSEHERLDLKPGEKSILEAAPAKSSIRDDSESDVSHETTNRATTDASTPAVQRTISGGSSEKHVTC